MFDKADIKNIDIEKNILLPVIRAQDCGRYRYANPSKYIIYPYYEADGETIVLPETQLKKEYPKTYKYLLNNKSILIDRKDSRKSVADKKVWYGLVRFGRYDVFKRPKIVFPGEENINKFGIDNTSSGYSGARVFSITVINDSIDISSLLGIMNSSFIQYYLHSVTPAKAGGYFSYSADFIDSIPVPKNLDNCKEDLKIIKQNVKKLLDSSKKATQDEEKNSELENNINEAVYRMYELSIEEIRIVEGTTK
jgi:hypothetical protein